MLKTHTLLLSLVAVAALQACSTVPVENPALTVAQARYQTALDTPAVAALASSELRDAQLALDQAQTAWGKQEKTAEVNHLAYLAGKKVEIAEELARQRLAERSIQEAEARRTQTLLAARTLEAENAQRTAEEAQRAADLAKQQANAASASGAQARQDAQAAEARAAALAAQLSAMDAKSTDRGMVVTIGDLLFDTNSATLKPGADSSVQRLGAFLKAYPERRALIEGHTDSVGSTESNQLLSERRANAVRSALLATGVGADRLDVRGYGKTYPIGNNQTAEGRMSNRRVEVLLSDDSGRIQARTN
jgi:outer membrane protein OmpA-like peptidoglycan-associated protein